MATLVIIDMQVVVLFTGMDIVADLVNIPFIVEVTEVDSTPTPSVAGVVETLIERTDCPAMGKSCRNCGKSNHFSICCRSRNHNVDIVEDTATYFLGTIDSNEPPWHTIEHLWKKLSV